MSAHTKGRLHAADSGVLVDVHGRALAILGGIGFDGTEMGANGKRLAACWNACKGLADPAVVPELVAALERIAQQADLHGGTLSSDRVFDIATAALRRARGEPLAGGDQRG